MLKLKWRLNRPKRILGVPKKEKPPWEKLPGKSQKRENEMTE